MVESHLSPACPHPQFKGTFCLQNVYNSLPHQHFQYEKWEASPPPPLVIFHRMLPPPLFQLSSHPGFPWRRLLLQAVRRRKGPQYPKSPLGKSHTLYGSISAFLWSSRILPLNNTDTDSQLRARTDSKSSSVPALQTRRMGRGKIFSPLCKSTWKIHPAEGFLQLPT